MGLFPVTCTGREEPEFFKRMLESVFTQDTAYTVNNQYGYCCTILLRCMFKSLFVLLLTSVMHACINLQHNRKSQYRRVELSVVLLLCQSIVSLVQSLSRVRLLWPHGLQYARPPCPSLTPGDYSNSSHWVGDAIQPSHPLSSPSPPALSLSQHQGLFRWISSSRQVAKGLEFQLQHQSFQWTPRTDLL